MERDELQVYPRKDGRWAWRRVAETGDVIATDGGQGYENEAECQRMAERCARPAATMVRYEADPRG